MYPALADAVTHASALVVVYAFDRSPSSAAPGRGCRRVFLVIGYRAYVAPGANAT